MTNNKKTPDEIKHEMDEAAKIARKDLEKMSVEQTRPVATWIKNHYLKAGYKRLCRMLLEELK